MGILKVGPFDIPVSVSCRYAVMDRLSYGPIKLSTWKFLKDTHYISREVLRNERHLAPIQSQSCYYSEVGKLAFCFFLALPGCMCRGGRGAY